LVLFSILSVALALNNSPIIGIFSQPSTSNLGNCNGDCLYIAASYVKYLEASGARVVPIDFDATDAELDSLLGSLNGLLFPGGGAAFPKSAQYAFDKVRAMNDAGDPFPLWGTCMGFQWLLLAASDVALDPPTGQMDSYNISLSLNFTSTYADSRVLGGAPVAVLEALSREAVTMNNHHYGIYPDHFASTPALSSFYNLLSTSQDRQGVPFVSMMEAFNYPIFGSQWHPEKNNFEWAETADGTPAEAIDHSPNAVMVSQYMATFFVNQARLSAHSYSSEAAEDAALIYNYTPTKSSSGGSFVQSYYFHF